MRIIVFLILWLLIGVGCIASGDIAAAIVGVALLLIWVAAVIGLLRWEP